MVSTSTILEVIIPLYSHSDSHLQIPIYLFIHFFIIMSLTFPPSIVHPSIHQISPLYPSITTIHPLIKPQLSYCFNGNRKMINVFISTRLSVTEGCAWAEESCAGQEVAFHLSCGGKIKIPSII